MFKPDNQLRAFLDGNAFSNGLRVKVGQIESRGLTRLDVLKRLVQGKHVLHVGFADHLELIELKRTQKRWLHDWLIQWTSRVAGVDINENAVAFVRRLGVKDIYVADITKGVPADLAAEPWDTVLLGEVLEHVDDPVGFLRAVAERWTDAKTELVITVPNAFSATNIEFAAKNVECINTDHRFWFTPFTLAKVMRRAGWQLEDLQCCQFDGAPSGWRRFDPRNALARVAAEYMPLLRDTLVARARRVV